MKIKTKANFLKALSAASFITAILVLVYTSLFFYTHKQPADYNEILNIVPRHEFVLFASNNGQTAFDLAKANLQLDYKKYDFGIFITGINGIKADKNHFWAFYVNDKFATKGVSQTILKKGDKIKFVYEPVKK